MQAHPQPRPPSTMSVNPVWPVNPNLSLESLRMNPSASNAIVSQSNGACMQQLHSGAAYSGAGESTNNNNSLPQLSSGDLACLDPEPQGTAAMGGQIQQENQVHFSRKSTTSNSTMMMQAPWGHATQPCPTPNNGPMVYSSFLENLCEDLFPTLNGPQQSTALPKQEQQPGVMMVQAPSASATADCQQSYTTLHSCSNSNAQDAAMRQMNKAANVQSTIDTDTLEWTRYYTGQ